MRGEICLGVATFFSFVALILLIFANVAQINTSAVPRKLHMVQVNMSNYGIALEKATGVTVPGLYNDNASEPLEQGNGIRNIYSWGIYGYCTYMTANLSGGHCGNSTFGNQFTPMDVLLADTPPLYNVQTRTLVPNEAAFKNSSYLGGLTKPAFWLLFIGTICAGLAVITGVIVHKITFTLAAFFSIVGTIFILVGASIWTSVINKTALINNATVRGTTVNLGFNVTAGSALWLFWASFVMLGISTVPYTISCWAFLIQRKQR